jgi:polar amino acid transport system substrate-binding protein
MAIAMGGTGIVGAYAASTPEATPDFAAMLPESVRESGTLNIAISLAYPPMEYSEPGSTELIGVDIDLAKEVAARLELEPNFQNYEFAQLIPSLTTGRSDIIWTAMTDLNERHERVSFIDYFRTGNTFFAPAEYRDQFKGIEDLCGETVTVATGTSWVQEVEELSKQLCGDNQMTVLQVPTLSEQILQMKQKRAVAGFMGFEGVLELEARQEGEWFRIGELQSESHYGIGTTPENEQLREAILAVLNAMLEDGTYVEILEAYGMQEAAVEEFTINNGI